MYENIAEQNILSFVNSFDTVLTDCDGVLWHGPEALEGASETFVKLKQLGKRIFPITNNSTNTRSGYVNKFKKLGFHVEKDDIISSAFVTAQYLKEILKYEGKVFMVGSPGLHQELTDVGYEVQQLDKTSENHNMKDLANSSDIANLKLDPDVKCVVVGFDGDFNFIKLSMAVNYLQIPGSFLVVTDNDPAHSVGKGRILPGTGSIVSAITTASNREPTVICGKPYHPIYDVAHKTHNINPETTIIIGDSLYSDIGLAHNCGVRGLHVLTGTSSKEDVLQLQSSNSIENQKRVPHYYVESFGTLGQLMDKMNVGDH